MCNIVPCSQIANTNRPISSRTITDRVIAMANRHPLPHESRHAGQSSADPLFVSSSQAGIHTHLSRAGWIPLLQFLLPHILNQSSNALPGTSSSHLASSANRRQSVRRFPSGECKRFKNMGLFSENGDGQGRIVRLLTGISNSSSNFKISFVHFNQLPFFETTNENPVLALSWPCLGRLSVCGRDPVNCDL
jgi:hypothetical protein